MNLHQASSQEDDGIDETCDPRALGAHLVKAKLLGETQVGTVGTGLIPALCGGSDGTEANGVPEHLGTVPLVIALVDESGTLVFGQVGEVLEPIGITCHESCLGEEADLVGHAVGLSKDASI